MLSVVTVFRRDLAAYFTSPVGYIYMIVFLIISVGLYMTTFFTFPIADMRAYFTNLPILLCVFIPAVTMRIWAEERKENTWEMLLTFPMRARELVLGKFLAAFVFYVLTIAATLTLPAMLMRLGDPDNGAIFGGYVGTLLLGAFFLSLGIFFSGFCKDQIVAFVVTLLVCFSIFLVGTEFVASYINGAVSGLGTFLSRAVGLLHHYGPFTRGVLEAGEVLYFVGWAVLFLMLNMMYIDGRHRPGARTMFGTAVGLCVAIGLAFNWLLAGQSLGRFDLTEDKIYTVSPATRTILSGLEAPVQVSVYMTPAREMPTSLATLEQDVTDKLEELRVGSGGKLQYTVVPMRAANVVAKAGDFLLGEEEAEEKDEGTTIEERMRDKGVVPFVVQDIAEDQVTTRPVYSSIGVAYRDKPEEFIQRVMPETLDELEYLLVNIIYKITLEETPKVALVAPRDTISPEMRQIYAQLGQPIPPSIDPYSMLERWLEHEKYEVNRVDLTKESPLPEDYDTLVVLSPSRMNDRQRYEINRALVSGKPVILSVQTYLWDYRIDRNRLSLAQNQLNPEVNPLLEAYGLGVSEEILMDDNHVALSVPASGDLLSQLLNVLQPINLPMHIYVPEPQMNHEASITNWLSTVFYLWGSPLTLDEDKLKELGLEHRVLMTTSERAWTAPGDADSRTLNEALMTPPDTGKQYPLMVMVTGQFPDAFKDKPRPAWPPSQPRPGMPPVPTETPEEGEPSPWTPAPGELILIGCAQPFNDNFINSVNNKDLLLNSVDAVSLGEELIDVRAKKPTNRVIARPDTRTRVFWKVINYSAMNLLIVGIGALVAIVRRRARVAYALAYAAEQDS